MIRRTTLLGCVLALALPIVGCDSDPEPMDGGGGGTDAGMTDSGMMQQLPDPVTVQEGGAAVAADFSCRGTATAPTGGSEITVNLFGEDRVMPSPVAGLAVDVFLNNTVVETCAAPDCVSVTTDASGLATFMAPDGGWYAYRINPGDATRMGQAAAEPYLEVVQVNEPASTSQDDTTMTAISTAGFSALAGIATITAQPGTTTLTGTIEDCAGRPVQNAVFRVFNSAGEVTFARANTGPKQFYFAGALPNATFRSSSDNGLFGAGNVPADGGTLRVETWGVTSTGGELELLGCENIDPVADGVSIVNIGGQRSDGPSGCTGS